MKSKENKSGCVSKLDATIWANLKKGDVNALGELYNIFIDELIQHGLKFSGDKNKVMDSIHDLFIDLYKYRTKLSDVDSVEYYLKTSLKRKLFKLKSVKEIPMQSDILIANIHSKKNYTESHEENIIFAEIIKEKSAKLLKAFESLTKNQRASLNLRFNQNYSYEEIAQTLDISVGSARTSIYRAVKSLKQYMFLVLLLAKFIFF